MKKENDPIGEIFELLDQTMLRLVKQVESNKVHWLRNLRRTACVECGAETIFDKCIECQKAESEQDDELRTE